MKRLNVSGSPIKKSKSEKTRQFIIEKAAEIFNMYGYAGTTMSQLTKAIGMTKGAIYGNFKNKDEIASATFEYNISRVMLAINEDLSKKNDANDKLIEYAHFPLKNFSYFLKTGGCPLLSASVDCDFAHPELKKKVAQAIKLWLAFVANIISEGIDQKQINENINPEKYASLFGSLIEGGLMLSQITDDPIYLSRNVNHIIHLVNTELRIK